MYACMYSFPGTQKAIEWNDFSGEEWRGEIVIIIYEDYGGGHRVGGGVRAYISIFSKEKQALPLNTRAAQ